MVEPFFRFPRGYSSRDTNRPAALSLWLRSSPPAQEPQRAPFADENTEAQPPPGTAQPGSTGGESASPLSPPPPAPRLPGGLVGLPWGRRAAPSTQRCCAPGAHPTLGSTPGGYMEYTPKYHCVNWPAVATMPPVMRTVGRGEAGQWRGAPAWAAGPPGHPRICREGDPGGVRLLGSD